VQQIELSGSFLTTREAAQMLGVSLRTTQLWVENGQLDAWKTEGGHRRISPVSVQRLLNGNIPIGSASSFKLPPPERIRVLIIEDDSILLKLYRTVFDSWKMPLEIITAGNGVDALIRIGKDAPDLMITDLSMPGMDGFRLLHSLATSSFREGLEIVVVSGLGAAEIEDRGGLPVGVPIFPKPVPFVQLKAIVSSIVKRRAAYL
jgi:excisionase family DNA binding protein